MTWNGRQELLKEKNVTKKNWQFANSFVISMRIPGQSFPQLIATDMDGTFLDSNKQFDPEFIDIFYKLKEKGINLISISLHYGIQEQISKSSLEEISKVIIDAVKDGFSVRVLCTITKDNYKLVPYIAEYVHSLGVNSLKFINMLKEGNAENLGDIFLNQNDINEFFDILEETRKQYDKNEFYITRNGSFGNDEKRPNNFMCPAGEDFVIITPDHKVYPCNGLNYDEYCIGHWDDTGIYIDKKIEHSKKMCLALKRQL